MFVISYKVKQACRNLYTALWYQSFKCGHQSVLKSKISHRLGMFNLSTVTLTWGSPLHDRCTNYLPRNSYDVIRSQSGVLSLILILWKPDKKQRYLAFGLACSASRWEHATTIITILKYWKELLILLLLFFYSFISMHMKK